MNPENAFLAKKYATAFVAVAGAQLDESEFHRIRELHHFLQDNHPLLAIINFPLISTESAHRALFELFKHCSTASLLHRLALLLMRHRRAILLSDVLYYIAQLYQQKNNTLFFHIASSHPLSDRDMTTAVQFLERNTGKRVMYDYATDERLIAGIRLRSEGLLWEHSIKKQLNGIKRTLVDQGVLWK